MIYFYNSNEPYYQFTNFFDGPFQIEDKLWPTSEHFFQAHKFIYRPDLMEQVRMVCFLYDFQLATPRQAFEFVRRPELKSMQDPQWDTNRLTVMKRALGKIL